MVDAVLERIVKAGLSHPTPGADLLGDLDPTPSLGKKTLGGVFAQLPRAIHMVSMVCWAS